MLKFKKEVPSLELCKKLKEAGFPQEGGGFYWLKWDGKDEWGFDFYTLSRPWEIYRAEFLKAPTAEEMLSVLGYGFGIKGVGGEKFMAFYEPATGELPFEPPKFFNSKPADALAEMVLWALKWKKISIR